MMYLLFSADSSQLQEPLLNDSILNSHILHADIRNDGANVNISGITPAQHQIEQIVLRELPRLQDRQSMLKKMLCLKKGALYAITVVSNLPFILCEKDYVYAKYGLILLSSAIYAISLFCDNWRETTKAERQTNIKRVKAVVKEYPELKSFMEQKLCQLPCRYLKIAEALKSRKETPAEPQSEE